MSRLPSYIEFYPLPQWTPHQYQQSWPTLQAPYDAYVQYHAYPGQTLSQQAQYTYTDVHHAGQSHASLLDPPMNNVREQPIRRKRASKPKVRSGCTTCKIRRVKCDEAKPNCIRCTSTGRKCDGYEFPRKDSTSPSIIASATPPAHGDKGASRTPQSSLPPHSNREISDKFKSAPEAFVPPYDTQGINQALKGTVQERRAFHRFKLRTVPAFAGGSESEFWTGLVLRAAVSEPVIKDAVVALGSLHEEYEASGGRYDQELINSTSYKDTALLYGRAIRKLYQRIDIVTGETASLAIIASILFACFEVLRRNNMAAVMHYQNGMRQLMKQMNERNSPRIEEPRKVAKDPTISCTPHDDLDRMLRVFARYDIQACTFSKPKAETLNVGLPAIPPNDVGLTEVRRYLDTLLIAVYQLVKSDLSMFRYWRSAEVSPSWLAKRDEALNTFQIWLAALERSMPSDDIALRNHGITASKSILGLILQVKIAMIMLKTCIDCGPETTFDQFAPEFEEMVSRVEGMTKMLGLTDGTPLDRQMVPFSMELGVIHPLFFIAWKCRDWNIRRRAIAALKKCGKEGVWEGPIMAVVAQRICQIEEQGLQPCQHVPEGSRIHELRKAVEYDERIVRLEIRQAQNSAFTKWSVRREAVPF